MVLDIVRSIYQRDLKCFQPQMCGSQPEDEKVFLLISRLPHKLHSRIRCVLQTNKLKDTKAEKGKDPKIRAF